MPVLVDGDTTLTQSGVILDYISSKTGKLGGRSATERREVLRWLFWDNHKGSSQFGALRFLMNFLPEDKRPAAAITWLSGRVQAALKTLEAHLANRDWMVGQGPTIADFACCGYLYYPEPFGFERENFPAISRWLDRIAALEGWRHPYDMMPGNPSDRA